MIKTENHAKIEIEEKIAALMTLAGECKKSIARYAKERPDRNRLWELEQVRSRRDLASASAVADVQEKLAQCLRILVERIDEAA